MVSIFPKPFGCLIYTWSSLVLVLPCQVTTAAQAEALSSSTSCSIQTVGSSSALSAADNVPGGEADILGMKCRAPLVQVSVFVLYSPSWSWLMFDDVSYLVGLICTNLVLLLGNTFEVDLKWYLKWIIHGSILLPSPFSSQGHLQAFLVCRVLTLLLSMFARLSVNPISQTAGHSWRWTGVLMYSHPHALSSLPIQSWGATQYYNAMIYSVAEADDEGNDQVRLCVSANSMYFIMVDVWAVCCKITLNVKMCNLIHWAVSLFQYRFVQTFYWFK